MQDVYQQADAEISEKKKKYFHFFSEHTMSLDTEKKEIIVQVIFKL